MLRFGEQVCAGATLGERAGDSQFVQFRPSGFRFSAVGKIEINVAKSGSCFLCISGSFVGAAKSEFEITAQRSAVLFEKRRGFLRAAFLQQRAGVEKMGIANQKRIGKLFAEIDERGQGFAVVACVQVRLAEIVRDVISKFAGSGLGSVERVDRFGIVVIERIGVSNDEPRQSGGIGVVLGLGFGMKTSIGFDSGIRSRSTILEQLLRHGTKTGGGDKGLTHSAHARRNGSSFLLGVRWNSGFLFRS